MASSGPPSLPFSLLSVRASKCVRSLSTVSSPIAAPPMVLPTSSSLPRVTVPTVGSAPFESTLSAPTLQRPLHPTSGGLDHLVLPEALSPLPSPVGGPGTPGQPTARPPPRALLVPMRRPRSGLPLGPPSGPDTLLALPPCRSLAPWALPCLSTASSPSLTRRPKGRSFATGGCRRPRARQAPAAAPPSTSTSSTPRSFHPQSQRLSSGLPVSSSGWT